METNLEAIIIRHAFIADLINEGNRKINKEKGTNSLPILDIDPKDVRRKASHTFSNAKNAAAKLANMKREGQASGSNCSNNQGGHHQDEEQGRDSKRFKPLVEDAEGQASGSNCGNNQGDHYQDEEQGLEEHILETTPSSSPGYTLQHESSDLL